jgi:hypothetical protein
MVAGWRSAAPALVVKLMNLMVSIWDPPKASYLFQYFAEGPNPYNTEGSLFVWNKKLCQLKKAHFRSETDSGTFDKTYTINDVKFNNSG